MKTLLLPKHVPAAFWGIFVVLVFCGLAIVYLHTGRSVALAGTVAEVRSPGGDIPDIERAMNDLKDMSRRRDKWGQRFATAEPILAPSPAVLPRAKAAQGGEDTGRASLILLDSAKGAVAVIDGRVARVGQRLDNGDVVQRIGNTFVILKPPNGEARRLDMDGRFSPPNPKAESVK